jgi:hypothetical protein
VGLNADLICRKNSLWSYSVVVITVDFESANRGSNPRRTLLDKTQSIRADIKECLTSIVKILKMYCKNTHFGAP